METCQCVDLVFREGWRPEPGIAVRVPSESPRQEGASDFCRLLVGGTHEHVLADVSDVPPLAHSVQLASLERGGIVGGGFW